MKLPKLIMAAIAVVLSSCSTPSELAVTDLKCEYRNNPLGIDNTQPRLSWRLEETNFARGQQQTAYKLLVASSSALLDGNTGDVWDSGKVASDQSVNVLYQGTPLESTNTYMENLKVGLFGIGLDTYWPQFKGLKERLEGYQDHIAKKMESFKAQVVNVGLVDSPEKAIVTGQPLGYLPKGMEGCCQAYKGYDYFWYFKYSIVSSTSGYRKFSLEKLLVIRVK